MKYTNTMLLRHLREDEKEFLNLQELHYKKNTIIHFQDDSCECIEIILKGKLTTNFLAANGQEMTVFDLGKNNVVGANLIFSQNNHYPMNITCLEDVTLIKLTKNKLEYALHNYEFSLEFIKSISHNSLGMNQKIKMYKSGSLKENILGYFNELAKAQKSQTINLPVTKAQLAHHLGVQRPSLFRELKKLKDEGYLDYENRKIILYNKVNTNNTR